MLVNFCMLKSWKINLILLFFFFCRFFKQMLIIFLIQNLASAVFRLIGGVCRSMIVAHTGGALVLFIVFLLSGFILPIGWFFLDKNIHFVLFVGRRLRDYDLIFLSCLISSFFVKV